MISARCLGVLALALALSTVTVSAQVTPKQFGPPARTDWKPVGCRTVPSTHPALPAHFAWRNLHSDETNTDEVSIALAPVFSSDWTAEPATFNPTGPVFDSAENLYFAPFQPYENVAMISLEPASGTRRWSIPNTSGDRVGFGTPMVLADPDNPGQEIVYQGLYSRAFAVRTDGTIVWDVPTGLGGPSQGVFGVNYLPQVDAIVGLTGDGYIYVLDRRTGAQKLAAPFQLPGSPSPAGAPPAIPPSAFPCLDAQLGLLTDLQGFTFVQFLSTLLGNGVEVANFFSIDPNTGHIWIGATAPDAEDGTVDGISQLGALYRLEVLPQGAQLAVVEECHSSFQGGTASTPALPRNGGRVYVGDNFTNLIAIDDDCTEAWRLDVGAQIFGSIEVSADNHEIYAASATGIVQVIDQGTSGVLQWTANLDVFDTPANLTNFNLLLTGIGANGLFFQAGSGLVFPTANLPAATGVGVLDRLTGQPRYFAGGLDESVAVLSTGPDGALYIGNSPIRRLIALCLDLPFPGGPPAVGGIHKWTPARLDLLIRDATCAASDRAANASANAAVCPDSGMADINQLRELLAQSRRASAPAQAANDLTAKAWQRYDRSLTRAEHKLDMAQESFASGLLQKASRRLKNASRSLRSVCKRLDRHSS